MKEFKEEFDNFIDDMDDKDFVDLVKSSDNDNTSIIMPSNNVYIGKKIIELSNNIVMQLSTLKSLILNNKYMEKDKIYVLDALNACKEYINESEINLCKDSSDTTSIVSLIKQLNTNHKVIVEKRVNADELGDSLKKLFKLRNKTIKAPGDFVKLLADLRGYTTTPIEIRHSTALTSETIFIDINTTAHNLEYDTHIWLHKSTRDNEDIAYKYSSIHVSIYYGNHMKYFTYNFNFRDKQLLADIFNCLLKLDETNYFSQNEVKYVHR